MKFDLSLLPGIRIDPLAKKDIAAFRKLTFPRFGENLDTLSKSWVAIGAWHRDTPIGLALGRMRRAEGPGHLVSIAVAPAARRRGIGRKLLTALEDEMRNRGASQIYARYVAGMKAERAFTALLNRLDWMPGKIVELSLTGEAGKMAATGADWLGVRAWIEKPEPFSFPVWSDFTATDLEDLARLQGQAAYHAGFEFESHRTAIDPACSLHIRRNDALVGWIAAVPFEGALTAPYPGRVCRLYVSAYVDEALWRSAVMIAGYYHAFSRQAVAYGTDTIATYFSGIPGQMALTRRRFAPLALSMDEIVEISKDL